MACHDRLVTNSLCYKRHIHPTGFCDQCGVAEETTLHVLRDCECSRPIWLQLVQQEHWNIFFSLDLHGWLHSNLSNGKFGGANRDDWSLIFGVAMWWLWRWRNSQKFEVINSSSEEPIGTILREVKTIKEAIFLGSNPKAAGRQREEVAVAWKPPPHGWVKLNTDGAVHLPSGMASAGGLIRDDKGHWLGGFGQKIGICTPEEAELWGICTGLEYAWNKGYKNILVETDSRWVVDHFHSSMDISGRCSSLGYKLKFLLKQNWTIDVSHIYREGNLCADWLSKDALGQPLGFRFFASCPMDLLPAHWGDICGIHRTRYCINF